LKNYDDDFKNNNLWWNDLRNIKPDLFLNMMLHSPYK